MISYKSHTDFRYNHLKKAYQNNTVVYIFPTWFLLFGPIPLKHFAYKIVIFETVGGYTQFKKIDSGKIVNIAEPFSNVYLPNPKKIKKPVEAENQLFLKLCLKMTQSRLKNTQKQSLEKYLFFQKS
jgi:hypothetical protein